LSQRDTEKLIRKYRLALSCQGQAIPYFSDKENRGIYFYGFAHNDVFSDENIFWLSLGPGQRMQTLRLDKPKKFFADQSFTFTLHKEEDNGPVLSQPWENTDDYWVWSYAFSGYPGLDLLSFAFQVDNPAVTSDNAAITLHFVGGSVDGAGNDHLAEVKLNGYPIGECIWQGIDLLSCEMQFPQYLLQEGENVLDIRGVLLGGAGFSLFYVDSFDVRYSRTFQAVENSLFMRGDGHETVNISGFESSRIYLLDISDPFQPRFIDNLQVKRSSGNTYQLLFNPESPDTDYLAAAEPALLSPLDVIPYTYTDLKGELNRANYWQKPPPPSR